MTGLLSHIRLNAFQDTINYRFQDISVLIEALTHSSAASVVGAQNERLEFLGDRVLGLVIAQVLFSNHPAAEEGEMARALNALVRKEACVVVARQIDLGAIVVMDAAEARAGGRDKKGMLGDACEAVIAAIYLDGGLEPARSFILEQWAAQIESARDVRADAKSALQEWAHAKLAVTPTYETVLREGPDHMPTFTVEASAGELAPGRGVGRSKRDAEQVAAEVLLRREGIWS